ncbi:MAG: SPFH domain-containing protein [Myxococcales bacterium]
MRLLHVLLPATLFATACTTVPAGYRGVKVYYFGTDSGVDTVELGIGRYLYWPLTQDIYKFPVFQQNVVWSKATNSGITFQTSEGVTVGGDFGMSYAIDPTKVAILFQKYRRGIDEITDMFLRHIVVDACNVVAAEMSVEALYGQGKVELLRRVNEMVAEEVRPFGINIQRIHAVGEFRLPPQVVAAINSKIEATQRAQQRENELRETQAESAKRVAAAKGEADAMRLRAEAEAAMSRIRAEADAANSRLRADAEANNIAARERALTPAVLKYEAIQRWNGQLPRYVGTGSAIPFLDLEDLEGDAPQKPLKAPAKR